MQCVTFPVNKMANCLYESLCILIVATREVCVREWKGIAQTHTVCLFVEHIEILQSCLYAQLDMRDQYPYTIYSPHTTAHTTHHTVEHGHVNVLVKISRQPLLLPFDAANI